MAVHNLEPLAPKKNALLSLTQLLDPKVLANPYPLFHRLRTEDPVHWDPFLHAWVVTRYADVVTVLHHFSADRTPTPEHLAKIGLGELAPIAQVMVKQMLFLDPPAHTRIRRLASYAFTPGRVAVLRNHIRDIVKHLIDAVAEQGRLDVIADIAEPLPYTVTAEMLGVPIEDAPQLKAWSQDFAEMLGNFQHNPERAPYVRRSLEEMTKYFQSAIREMQRHPREGLIHSFLTAESDGDRYSEEEVIANTIITMVGGQETTTNLIGNGVLTLLRNPEELARLKADLSLIPSAVEEMLRYEPPSQHTARLAPGDVELGGKKILTRQAVIAVMAAGNRDPERFPEPDHFDIERKDNRHLSFGWAAHFCFGAALARIEGQEVFEEMLRRLHNLTLEPGPFVWRTNLGLRGLIRLPVRFGDKLAKTMEPERFVAMGNVERAPDAARLSNAKRKLLERYVRGDLVPAERQAEAITRRPLDQPVPLSLSQEQLWQREQKEGIPPLYNESITIRRSGALDVTALERVLAEIVRRHEIWRTTYDTSNGVPIQVIHPAPSRFPLSVVDLRGFPEVRLEDEILRITSQETRRAFDLRRGPLLRGSLLRTGDAEYRLFMVAHLSIVDGISVYQVFPSELATLYSAFSADKPSPLPEPRIQYADYAYWQRWALKDEERAEQLAYWRKELRGDVPILEWPNDHPRPGVQTYRGAIRTFALSSALTDATKELSRREGVTLFTILLASFSSLLHRYTGQVDLVIGTLSPAGRKRPETQPLLGYFLNPVALRIDLQGDPTFRDLLARVQNVVARALCYDDLPLETVAKELQVKPDLSRNPFFTVAISLQPKTPHSAEGWQVTSMDAESGGAPWDLYLAFIDGTDGLLGRAQYNPDLFASASITEMLNHLPRLMNAVTADPGQRLSKMQNHF